LSAVPQHPHGRRRGRAVQRAGLAIPRATEPAGQPRHLEEHPGGVEETRVAKL